MATCDWCGFEDEDGLKLRPVVMARHTNHDGEPSDEELREHGLSAPRTTPYGTACEPCVDRIQSEVREKGIADPPAFWIKEHEDRDRRAVQSLRRRRPA